MTFFNRDGSITTGEEVFAEVMANMELRKKGLIDVGHTYEKCGSPIEDDFQHQMLKFASQWTKIYRQFKVLNYRIDFVLESKSRKIGIECDGRDFHDRFVDCIRDRAIIGTGEVDRIIRLPGKDIWWCRNEVMVLLSWIEPSLWHYCVESESTAAHPRWLSEIGSDHEEATGYSVVEWRYFDFDQERSDRMDWDGSGIEESQRHSCIIRHKERTPTRLLVMDGKTIKGKTIPVFEGWCQFSDD